MPVNITDFVEDYRETGLLKKGDLVKSPNLKKTFLLINKHLYGKLKYTDTDTRTRSKEIVNLLLCKLVDEISKAPHNVLDFSIRTNETKEELFERIQVFFQTNVKEKYRDIFEENEQISLNEELVYLIVEKLQKISLFESSKDILSDAFEIFVSKMLKDEGGQFFTPPSIVRFMVNYLDPDIDSKILDPACGHGGFLLETKELVWSKIEFTHKNKEDLIKEKKVEFISNLYGIDKDLFLAKICKLYLEILSGGKSNVFCEDSLNPLSYRPIAKSMIRNNTFDYILTNPPFGAKIPIDDKKVLNIYELGRIWKNVSDNKWKKQIDLKKKQPPQILFIERCVQLLKDDGKLGIVLPEGIFGNPSDRYIWEYLSSNGKILGIVSLDQNTFQPYTCNKASVLFFQKHEQIPADYKIDFAIVDKVGHDKDGKTLYKLNKDGSRKLTPEGEPIIDNELINLHHRLRDAEDFDYHKDQAVFKIDVRQIKNKIFIPNYYTGVEKTLQTLSSDKNFNVETIRTLTERGIIYTNNNGYIPRGDEIGSHVYGLGEIPFIRTSELNNWEVNLESNKRTSEEVYEQYKDRQNIQEGDILLVKDGGPNLIGKTAYITHLDKNIVIQSHIYQFKILKNEEAFDSYLLLYLLNLDIVQKQIQAITFIQGTIATIGNRIMEIALPVPSTIQKKEEVSNYIREIIESKTKNKEKIRNLSLDSFLN